jgi:hypothetical protein
LTLQGFLHKNLATCTKSRSQSRVIVQSPARSAQALPLLVVTFWAGERVFGQNRQRELPVKHASVAKNRANQTCTE